MEAQSKAPVYSVLLDVLERRLGARRILRTAWVIEAETAQAVYKSLLYYRPLDDGLLILPFSEDRVERNLRAGHGTPRLDARASGWHSDLLPWRRERCIYPAAHAVVTKGSE
jgi:hypothetical protein